jgi:hypothetical protein
MSRDMGESALPSQVSIIQFVAPLRPQFQRYLRADPLVWNISWGYSLGIHSGLLRDTGIMHDSFPANADGQTYRYRPLSHIAFILTRLLCREGAVERDHSHSMYNDLVEALLVIRLIRIPTTQELCHELASVCESGEIGETEPSSTTEQAAEPVLMGDMGLLHQEARTRIAHWGTEQVGASLRCNSQCQRRVMGRSAARLNVVIRW